ncbi:dual specificity phosphatase [Nitzschia inconspicua]|uniref:protein-tyrosine-phosphatase n=1 Tax=Nitzschia inconspicua TaxID=303405 RepID=A0A9K3KIQ0_9STRA|nr:dual specificity phosphatase [Nitzschia inconspicua]
MSGNNGNGGLGSIGTKPTFLEISKMKFLIMDAPRQQNLHLYIKEMSKYAVTDVVRVCEPTYTGAELQQAGIQLHEMEYPDGHSPPQAVIEQWLQLVDKTFFSEASPNGDNANVDKSVAVHCVAGLGRAPVMVAIAMIEFGNYDPVEAVSMIRRHRRGAINEKQLLYLEGYKKTYRKKSAGGVEAGCGCVIS